MLKLIVVASNLITNLVNELSRYLLTYLVVFEIQYQYFQRNSILIKIIKQSIYVWK